MTLRTLLVWILTCGIWSTVWLCIKVGVGDVPPVTFAALRVVVALAVLAPLILWRRIELPHGWREMRLLATTGTLLLGVNYALLNWGMQFVVGIERGPPSHDTGFFARARPYLAAR